MKRITFILTSVFILSFLSSVTGSPENYKNNFHQGDTVVTIDEETHSIDSHEHSDHSESSTYSEIAEPGWSDFPSLHPMVVHFPVVLLLIALITQIVSFFIWKNELSIITLIILFGGAIGAFIASNYAHPHTTELNKIAADLLIQHELYAGYTKWLSLAAVVLKGLSHFIIKRKLWGEILVLIIMLGAAYSVSQAGHYGAALTHLHGIGVQGKYLENHLDDHEH